MSASRGKRRRSLEDVRGLSVWGYAVTVTGLWLVLEFLVDRVWPATLLGFGPRWIAAIPLLPLAGWSLAGARRQGRWLHGGVLTITAAVLLFGVMDFRLGLGRTSGVRPLRLMTHNVGGSQVTATALDRLMRTERIDVAALQECPFYDHGPARLGWTFFYGGDLCLVSRFPFTVLDVPDPDTAWEHSGSEPMRFEIQGPTGPFQLLNVHLETIREAFDGDEGWRRQFAANRAEARRQSARARARLRKAQVPLIVAGDFNLPRESHIYRSTWGDLRNAFSVCGRGFGHTKFTRAFAVRIDHVLMSGDWQCATAYVRASPYGGDHRPLIVEIVPRWSSR